VFIGFPSVCQSGRIENTAICSRAHQYSRPFQLPFALLSSNPQQFPLCAVRISVPSFSSGNLAGERRFGLGRHCWSWLLGADPLNRPAGHPLGDCSPHPRARSRSSPSVPHPFRSIISSHLTLDSRPLHASHHQAPDCSST
jgi:hypothetical protein